MGAGAMGVEPRGREGCEPSGKVRGRGASQPEATPTCRQTQGAREGDEPSPELQPMWAQTDTPAGARQREGGGSCMPAAGNTSKRWRRPTLRQRGGRGKDPRNTLRGISGEADLGWRSYGGFFSDDFKKKTPKIDLPTA